MKKSFYKYIFVFCFRSVVIAIVRMAGNSAINVAKLQEQLAKNMTIYSSNTIHKEQKTTTNEDNSVILNFYNNNNNKCK